LSSTRSIAKFVRELEFEDIPKEIIAESKYHILDALGVAFPAFLEKNSKILFNIVKEMSGKPESTILSFGEKSSTYGAALVNGMMIGTTLDFDDLHVAAGLHPTTITFPAALAASEAGGATGKELLAAFVAAAEVAIRMGLTAPGRYHKRGFQPTSIIGALASSLAAGKLMDLSEQQLADGIGIATNMAAASPLSVAVGSYFQGIDTGRASESGVFAASLAKQGFTSIREDALENRFGFLNTFAGQGNYSEDPLTRDLGKVWNLSQTFLKRYPTTYAFTRYLDAALDLRSQYGLKPEDIEEIEYGANSDHGPLFTTPYELKVRPPDRNEARTSQLFAMAAAFVDGKITLDTFDQSRISDPRILDLAKRIHVVDDEENFWVQVKTKKGTILKANKSELRQTSRKGVVEKFRTNATKVIGETQIETALASTLSLENESDLSNWVKLFVKQ